MAVTEETIARAKQTFPKFTVYVCYRGGETTARTGENYACMGKDYHDCTEALNKSNGEFKERQDEDLFNIVRKQELKNEKDINTERLVERLRDIAYELDDLIDDLED